MNTINFFEIQSSNPEREVQFYSAIFGWTFTKNEKLPIEYYQIEAPNMFGGLLKRPVPIAPSGSGTNAFTCSMEVSDFDESAKKILDLGGQVAMAKFAVPKKCWQGYFLDPDGNVFGIFEVDSQAGI